MFQRLEAAFEQQRRFTADASHELRTPVTIVLAQVEQALAKERSVAEYRDALEVCGRAANRMKLLVSGLLMLARADAGHWASKRSPAALDEIISSAAALLGGLACYNITSLPPAGRWPQFRRFVCRMLLLRCAHRSISVTSRGEIAVRESMGEPVTI